MERNVLRALLLALTVLLIGAVPVAAQTDDEGWLLSSDDDSVIIGIQQDVAVGPTDDADFVLVTEGEARIEGSVGTLVSGDADVTVSGTTARVDNLFTFGGTLTLENGATIGEGYYADTDVSQDTTATIEDGELKDFREEFVDSIAAVAMLLIFVLLIVAIGIVIATLALTLLVIAFGTEQTRRAGSMISNDVLKTIVVGVLALFVPNILFLLLAFTIVGLPLAIALWILWSVVAFLGQIVVATWIGERLLPNARTARRPYAAAFLGMIILILLWWTGVVPLLAGIFGTGAVTLAGWRMLRSGGNPPVPPGYGDRYGQPMQVAPPPYAPPPYAPPPPQQGGWPPQGGQPPGGWPQG